MNEEFDFEAYQASIHQSRSTTKTNRIMISEKELNSYRLTSMEEPTDEMLAQIMHEAAVLYRKENEDASKKVIDMIKEASNEAIAQYQTRYGRQDA